jgi:hypothetical protein
MYRPCHTLLPCQVFAFVALVCACNGRDACCEREKERERVRGRARARTYGVRCSSPHAAS